LQTWTFAKIWKIWLYSLASDHKEATLAIFQRQNKPRSVA
jgi:hypothetical protein